MVAGLRFFIMWVDTRQALALAFGWLLLVTAGFMLLRRSTGNDEPNRLFYWPIILLIAAIVRLVPAWLLPVGAGYDIESFKMVTDALLGGREVYTAALGRHPYLPFQMYLMGAMAYLSQGTGLPYVVAIKLPAVAADIALTGLIFRATLPAFGRVTAGYLALLYALNPVSMLVTAYHGQFEGVTLLLLTLSWWYWDQQKGKASSTALGFAILNKTWPVLFLPLIIIRQRQWRARFIYTLIALGIPALFALLYLVLFSADPAPMLRRALTHRGVPGYWGPGAALAPAATLWPSLQPLFDLLFMSRNWLLLAAALLTLWWTRRQPVLEAFLTMLLAIFAVTVGFGIQWLVWLVPFALLAGEDRWLRLYSLTATFMLTVHLFGLHMAPLLAEWLPSGTADLFIRLSSLPAWVVVFAWLVSRIKGTNRIIVTDNNREGGLSRA